MIRNIVIVIVAVMAALLVGKYIMFTDHTTPPKKAETKSDCVALCEITAAGIRTASVDTDDRSCVAACDAAMK